MDMELIVWGALLVLFVVVEGITAQLVTIWFAAGALAALIAQMCGAKLWLQITLFIVVSVITLLATRPLVKKYIKTHAEPTNLDRCVGTVAVVTAEINNIEGTGEVKADGKLWTARSLNGEVIPAGETVTVHSIDGVKLIVNL